MKRKPWDRSPLCLALGNERSTYTLEVREVRPVGRYTSSPAGDAHHEGGGAIGCILHYTVRGESDALFDVLDDDGNVEATLHTADFKAALDEQNQAK